MTHQHAGARRFQFSLRAMLVSTAIFAAVLGLTVWSHAPEIALSVSLAVLVLSLWRFTLASRVGLVFFTTGAYWLGIVAIDWCYWGEPWALVFASPATGSLLLTIGIVVFLLTPIWKKKATTVQLVCAAVALALLVAWWLIVPPLGG